MTTKSNLEFFPKGFSLDVPPSGRSGVLKIEKIHGKEPCAQAIYADNFSDLYLTIEKNGSDVFVENVALSVFRSDRPIPVNLPLGDYTVKITSKRQDTVTANLAFLIGLK